ncbi:hypothetical protein E1B28_004607 [Marasmius oreades]|uniref:HBS1-like protein N-terminal domain-containing protein n=1 Tax=Marasmius oreades TaxID=181124 RepID=A0A9P7UYW3_9AGAR|nr:uncharacterized protein E1B28_004607 [Marasmius oreades]KAG7097236.1 hypothetical protein E1B28_004607 [Marasmius oreades]
MSRHRYIKNLNISDELDDDALSDGGEEDMTAEQQCMASQSLFRSLSSIDPSLVQMIDALEQVRQVIGDEDISGMSDNEVRGTVWYYNFDVEESVNWCLQEQEKRRAARERQGSPPVQYTHYEHYYETNERPRIPLIHLAQQQMAEQQRQWEELDADGLERESEMDPTGTEDDNMHLYPEKRSLTPITEKTERTELSSLWRHRPPSDGTSTSYGNVLNNGYLDPPPDSPMDPNMIPLSPSESALHRLSLYEPAPSRTSSATQTSVSSSPRPPSEPVPPIDTIPDIPDSTSRSTHPTTQKSLHSRPTLHNTVKQSKLAQLASSRASSRTKSSTSLISDHSQSVKTYPGLRPNEHSTRPISSTVRQSIAPSSTSYHVDKAIQFAIEMEAQDRAAALEPLKTEKPLPKTPSARSKLSAKAQSSASTSKSVVTPVAPTPSKAPQMLSTDSPASIRPLSKLALLAQEKATKTDIKKVLSAPITRSPPQLPPEHTEYLIPVANGSSVTTAITTSYQTLYSLTDPSRPSTSDSPYVVPLSAVDYTTDTTKTSVAKPSKLAMKARKAQEKQSSVVKEETSARYEVPSMFLPHSTRSRGESTKKDKDKGKARSTASTGSTLRHHRSTRGKEHSIPDVASSPGFAFNIPSPDDIVLGARRGTTLDRGDRKIASAST